MRTSTIVAGLVGGTALAAVLIAPLYVALPGRYLVNWHFMTPQGGLAGMAAALLVWVAAGFLGALLHPEEPVRSGTVAGLLASVFGSLLMVMPATAVEACSDLVLTSGVGRTGLEKLQALTASALLDAAWLPAAAAAVMLCVGPALGAVGGVSFDLWRGIPGRPGRDLHYSVVPFVMLFSALGWGGGLLWALGTLERVVMPALAYEPTYVDLLRLTAPVGILGICTAGAVGWGLRDAVVLYRSSRRVFAVAWALVVLGIPPLLLVEVGALYPRAFISVFTWAGVMLCCVVGLGAVISAARSDDALDTQPRTFGELAGDALLASLAIIGQGALVGGTSAVGGYVLILPYIRALMDSVPLVSATPESLVALVFRVHWAAGAAVPVVALLWLFASLPIWLAVRALSGRRE